MKKIITSLFIIIAFTGSLAASENKPAIVISDFKRVNVSEAKSTILLENIINHIVQLQKYRVVERERFQKILAELNLSGSDLMDRDKAIKIGKLLSAQGIIVGTVVEDDGYLHINARLINVQSGEILKSAKIMVRKSEDLNTPARTIVYQLLGIRQNEQQAAETFSPATRIFNMNFTFGSGALGWAGGEWNFHRLMSLGGKIGFSAYRDNENVPWSYNLPFIIQVTGYLFDKTKSIRPYLSAGFGFAIGLNKDTDHLLFGLTLIGCEFNLSRSFSLFAEAGMIYKNAVLFQFGGGIKIFVK